MVGMADMVGSLQGSAGSVLFTVGQGRRHTGSIAATPLKVNMTNLPNQPNQGLAVSHLADAVFERGLRPFFEYRDLGIKQATDGQVVAHVIRAVPGAGFSSQPHLHRTQFQLVYVLKGWIEFEYEGQGVVRLVAGDSVHQPPGIRHRELGHSEDVELLELVMPADFKTETVDRVQA
jgi:quercetin dioxygenase-like cupin family protein